MPATSTHVCIFGLPQGFEFLVICTPPCCNPLAPIHIRFKDAFASLEFRPEAADTRAQGPACRPHAALLPLHRGHPPAAEGLQRFPAARAQGEREARGERKAQPCKNQANGTSWGHYFHGFCGGDQRQKRVLSFKPLLCGDFDHGTVRRPENPNINVSRNSQFQKRSQSHADLLYLVAGKLESLLCKQSPKVTK